MALLPRPLWHTLSLLGILWMLLAPQLPMPELPALAGEPPLLLSGRIHRLRGNRQPGPGPMPAPGLASGQDIVVVLGRIQPVQLGDPFLPEAKLQAPILSRGRSGTTGHFQLSVAQARPEPFEVTLLLVVPGGYYLNRFDGSGAFAAYRLPQASQQSIELLDDRGAVF